MSRQRSKQPKKRNEPLRSPPQEEPEIPPSMVKAPEKLSKPPEKLIPNISNQDVVLTVLHKGIPEEIHAAQTLTLR